MHQSNYFFLVLQVVLLPTVNYDPGESSTQLQTFRAIQELWNSLSLNSKINFIGAHRPRHNFLQTREKKGRKFIIVEFVRIQLATDNESLVRICSTESDKCSYTSWKWRFRK